MMRIFFGKKGTGKTKKLLELAAKNNAVVITPFAQAIKVKARSYGLNIEAVNPIDYTQNYQESYRGRKIAVINASEVMQYFINYYQSNNELIGMTVNSEE